MNDNYCVSCVAGNAVSVHVTGKEASTANSVTGNQDCFMTSKDTVRSLTVNSCVVNHAPSVTGLPQKKHKV